MPEPNIAASSIPMTIAKLSSNGDVVAESKKSEVVNLETAKDAFDNRSLGDPLDSIPSSFVNPEDVSMNEFDAQKLVWVEITAVPIYKLSNNVRAQQAFTDKSTVNTKNSTENAMAVTIKESSWYKFKFLSQQELMETISHSWEPYESAAQTIQQMYAVISKQAPEVIKGLFPSARNTKIGELFKTWSASMHSEAREIERKGLGKTLLNDIVDFGRSASKGGHVANYRVDTPLQYKGSERRTFDLIFNLINTKEGKNHERVVLPVKILEMLSSPSYGSTPDAYANVDIILPYLFTIRTTPGTLLTCDFAVLKSVQPTWKGPWIDGYPSRCELRLSFTEYRPLEQGVFYGSKDKVISTMSKQRKDSFEKQVAAEQLNPNAVLDTIGQPVTNNFNMTDSAPSIPYATRSKMTQ